MGKIKLARPTIGEPFNPWRRFNYLPVPEAIARSKELPPGAKLVYGRLLRFAGARGFCWPSVMKLAVEVGLGERSGLLVGAPTRRESCSIGIG
jgi:hypothetical protein